MIIMTIIIIIMIMGQTERTRATRIYAHNIGAYMQRLRLDCAGAYFAIGIVPNKTRFLTTIYDLVLQC